MPPRPMGAQGLGMPLLESTPGVAAAVGAPAFGGVGSPTHLSMFSSKYGQPPMAIGAPPWLPGGPYHVGHHSLGSKDGIQSGGWAVE